MRRSQRDAEFEVYVAAARPRLRRLAYSLCGDWHAADDIVQTALAKLYVVWPRVGRACDQDAYVRRTVARTTIDESRRPWRRESSGLEVHDGPAASSDVAAREGLVATAPPRRRRRLGTAVVGAVTAAVVVGVALAVTTGSGPDHARGWGSDRGSGFAAPSLGWPAPTVGVPLDQGRGAVLAGLWGGESLEHPQAGLVGDPPCLGRSLEGLDREAPGQGRDQPGEVEIRYAVECRDHGRREHHR